MIWHLKDTGVRRPHDLPEHIERRLRFAVSRFCGRIQKIVVFLEDHNGPRGGIDKTCRILVKTRGCGVVVATAAEADWITAVDQAAARIGRTLARQIARRRGTHDASARRPESRSAPAVGLH